MEYIKIDHLEAHPDNPRKDLGDLTELVQSIRQRGVLQNLTVTQHPEKPGQYRVLIGHRRLAAAREAGLETLPCTVVQNMTHSEQIAVMLAENMQRADLTLMEQVEGIQMMLELGETVQSISEKTGLSQSTVYRRKKLTELDRGELEKSFSAHQPTLEEYEKLEKVKNPERRNALLQYIGTSNFDWYLRQETDRERLAEKTESVRQALKKWAQEVEQQPEGYRVVHRIRIGRFRENETERPEEGGIYCFYIANKGTSYPSAVILQKSDAEAQKIADELAREREEKEQERQKAKEILSDISGRARERRGEFVKGWRLQNKNKAQHMNALLRFACDGMMRGAEANAARVFKAMGYDFDTVRMHQFRWCEGGVEYFTEYLNRATAEPQDAARLLLCALYDAFDVALQLEGWRGEYNEENAEYAKHLYAYLEALGYQPADEERAWLMGTHEAYIEEEDQ